MFWKIKVWPAHLLDHYFYLLIWSYTHPCVIPKNHYRWPQKKYHNSAVIRIRVAYDILFWKLRSRALQWIRVWGYFGKRNCPNRPLKMRYIPPCVIWKNPDVDHYTYETSKIHQKRSQPWPSSRHLTPSGSCRTSHTALPPSPQPCGCPPQPFPQIPLTASLLCVCAARMCWLYAMTISPRRELFWHLLQPPSCPKPHQMWQWSIRYAGDGLGAHFDVQ